MQSVMQTLAAWRNISQFCECIDTVNASAGRPHSLRRFSLLTQATICALDTTNSAFYFSTIAVVPLKIMEISARVFGLVLAAIMMTKNEMSVERAIYEITKEALNIGRLGIEIGVSLLAPQLLVTVTMLDIALRLGFWFSKGLAGSSNYGNQGQHFTIGIRFV